MSDGGSSPSKDPSNPPRDRLRDGPVLATLLSFAAPNAVALCSSAIITICETAYVGRLGIHELAGVTLVFPLIMLMQMMSGGAMGGAIAGAISRSLGAGDVRRAENLALSALVVGVSAGVTFALAIWSFGPVAYRALGGTGASLESAVRYSNIVAIAVVGIWTTNTLASIARGCGAMTMPAMVLLVAGLLQIGLGGALAFGLGPAPRLGLEGVALAQVAAFGMAAAVLFAFLRRSQRRVRLVFAWTALTQIHFKAILPRGALASLSPIQSVLTVLILTSLAARFGPEVLAGYGIGSRLEFLLIPVAFSFGVGAVPMVGVAIGAGNTTRARLVAWTASGLAAVTLGLIAAVVIAAPDIWAGLFAADGKVLHTARDYLRIASWGFPFLGISLCLYFAAQGAGKLIGPIVAQALRLGIIIIGGFALAAAASPVWTLFALAGGAMVAQALATIAAVKLTRWDTVPV